MSARFKWKRADLATGLSAIGSPNSKRGWYLYLGDVLVAQLRNGSARATHPGVDEWTASFRVAGQPDRTLKRRFAESELDEAKKVIRAVYERESARIGGSNE